jgi:hypothetical protein
MGRREEDLLAKRDELISRDAAQIAEIKGFGIDLDQERRIELTFWAPNADTANSLAEACRRNEMPPYLVLGPGSASETNQRWLIRCSFDASVTFMTAQENLVTFLLFADKFDCEYDGWGTALVEVAGPMTHVPCPLTARSLSL